MSCFAATEGFAAAIDANDGFDNEVAVAADGTSELEASCVADVVVDARLAVDEDVTIGLVPTVVGIPVAVTGAIPAVTICPAVGAFPLVAGGDSVLFLPFLFSAVVAGGGRSGCAGTPQGTRSLLTPKLISQSASNCCLISTWHDSSQGSRSAPAAVFSS